MVHLRLRAASCLLKLANVKVLDKAMTNVFEPLTYLFQVSLPQVILFRAEGVCFRIPASKFGSICFENSENTCHLSGYSLGGISSRQCWRRIHLERTPCL